jgi:hypothetical protein
MAGCWASAGTRLAKVAINKQNRTILPVNLYFITIHFFTLNMPCKDSKKNTCSKKNFQQNKDIEKKCIFAASKEAG